MKAEPLVSVVIPTYNRRKKVDRLIQSVFKSTYKKIEIIVVDDASTDGTYEYLKEKYGAFPIFKIIKNRKELYLAGSRNRGIKNSRGEFVFLIDADNVLHRECIKNLVRVAMRNNKIGMVGPIVLYLSEPKKIWFAGRYRSYFTSRTYAIRLNEIEDGGYSSLVPSDSIPNSFMIGRNVIEKVGLLNQRLFPIHYDEADFGRRVMEAGYKIYVVPKAKTYHDVEPLDKTKDLARSFNVSTPTRAFYTARNRIIFHKKYSKPFQFYVFAFIFNWLFTFFYLKLILFNNPHSSEKIETAKSYIRGVIEGYLIALKIGKSKHMAIP